MSSDNTTSPRIAIVGGGLGGLSLLVTLHRRGVPAVLYERDAGFNARAHLGGSLDLGWESGQRALRENGLQDEFIKNSRPEGEEMKIYDGTGKLYVHFGGEDEGPGGPPQTQGPEELRPEIDRTVLRELLLNAAPSHSIQWNHALISARSLGNGQHELEFANGVTTTCDFLVGADGANSRVRPLLSPAVPVYTGVNGVEISLAPETTKLPELAETVANIGQGMMFAMQNSRLFLTQLNGDGRVRIYVYVREAADWAPPKEPAAAKAALRAYFEGWPQWLLNLIDYCDESAIYPRALWILPVGHSWSPVRGVTLIGDAAHLMSPFAGAGANLAMLDGLELGLALAGLAKEGALGDAGVVDKTVAAFEEKMCAMAGRVADKANGNLHASVGPDTPQSAIKRFQETRGDGPREG